MTRGELQDYVYRHIPIVQVNNLVIHGVDNHSVSVAGSFSDHVNHRGSVFGGTIGTAMTVAAWAQVELLMNDIEPDADIVVARQTVQFVLPVVEDFVATSREPEVDAVSRFTAAYRAHGKAKLTVNAELRCAGDIEPRALFSGQFVVRRRTPGRA